MSLSRADLHIHTSYSDGLLEPEEAVNYAVANTPLRLIAITDHNTLDGARHAYDYWHLHRDAFGQLEVIIGEEISSRDGHILGLFLQDAVPPHLSAEETIRAIHEQGGVAIAAHPFTHLLSAITDLHGVGRKIAELPLDGVEVRNSVPTELYANLITQSYNAAHCRHAEVGGSDCHYLPMIGRTYTRFEGSAPSDLHSALLSRRTRAGGSVNGPLTVARFVRDQIAQHRLPLIREDDHHYRYAAPELTINVEEMHRDGAAILHCEGHVTRDNAAILKADMFKLLQAALMRLVVDLEKVSEVHGAGLGALLAARKRAQALGGDIAVAAPARRVAGALRLQRLHDALNTYPTCREAMAALLPPRSDQPPSEATVA